MTRIMVTEKSLSKGQIFSIIGGIISIISVFLPWYTASITNRTEISSLSINGMGWKSGIDTLGVIGGIVNWEFQGIGVLALGVLSILIAIIKREKLQSIAMVICGSLIIGGGAVNLYDLKEIGSFSGTIIEGLTIQSGIGYGLYVVVFAGIVTTAGGVLKWRDMNN